MKNYTLLLFITIILTIHFLANLYIYTRGIQALELQPQYKILFRWTMLVLFLAYPLGRFLEHAWYSPISNILHWIGAFWFAGMLYFIIALSLIDTTRLLNHFLPITSTFSIIDYPRVKFITGIVLSISVILLVLIGHINAWHPKIVDIQLNIPKKDSSLKELKIVAASDIHLGTIIGPRKTAKLVATINNLKPDIILLAGDVIDEDIQPVIKQNLGDSLKNLTAPLGVYAVTGNHEFIGGVNKAVSYLESHGIKVLQDTTVTINNSFTVIGRQDKDQFRFTGTERKSLEDLIYSSPKNLPTILLDHQPFHLNIPTKNKIDLQISGHTHHGQIWPLGYFTNKIFEKSRGYLKKEQTHFYVSTGFGTWGPPVRIGNRPEILKITLHFK